MTVIPQARFLEFLTEEGKRYPNFDLRMGAKVHELIEENGQIQGVRYRTGNDQHEIRSHELTVGADGRGSTTRRLANLRLFKKSVSMDVLWFRLPRKPGPVERGFRTLVGPGHMVVLLDRRECWQAGCIIRKGDFSQVREAGLDKFLVERAIRWTRSGNRLWCDKPFYNRELASEFASRTS